MPFKVLNINGNHENVIQDLFDSVTPNSNILFIDEPWFRKFNIKLLCNLIFSKKSVIYLHNLNRWYSNDTKWKQLYFRFVLFWINVILVPSDSMLSELKKHTNKRAFIWPFYTEISESRVLNLANSSMRIVVPGSVSAKRRNYSDIIKLAKYIISSDINIELIVLGRLLENESSECLRTLSKMSSKITVYNQFVDDPEFYRVLLSADLIIANSVEFCSNDGGNEIYGRTKETGSVFLAVNAGAHLLAPAYLQVPFGLEDLVLRWDNENDLVEIVEHLLRTQKSGPDYSKIIACINKHRLETICALRQW